jgi:hypothetical protein
VRVALVLLGTAGVAAGVYVLAAVPPTEDSYYPKCQLHSLTGLHCPGCGTTRALHALLNGRVAQAAAYNPLAFVVLPIVGWSLVRSVRASWLGRPVRRSSAPPRRRVPPWLILAALLLFAILRNLPVYPFNLLAPHEL